MKRLFTRGLKSYVAGTHSTSLNGKTIPEQLRHTVEKWASANAVNEVAKKRAFSFGDLERDTNNVAGNLISIGLKKGDRIGIYSVNQYEWIVTQLAAAKAGLILVCINPAYKPRELNYALNKVGVSAIVANTVYGRLNFAETLMEAMKSTNPLKHVVFLNDAYKEQNWRSNDSVNVTTFNNIMTEAGSEDLKSMEKIIANQDADEACNIQFTSGTTGNPKGATLTHHNIINNNFYNTTDAYGYCGGKIALLVPLYHSSGCVGGSMSLINRGCELVLPAPHFDPRIALGAINKLMTPNILGVPTMYLDMLNSALKGDGSFGEHPMVAYMGGAMCPANLRKALTTHVPNMEITIVYGTTENSPITFATTRDAPKNVLENTVGFVLPFTEGKIIDVQSNQIVPRKTVGEICTRGYCIFRGYWGDEEKTKEAIDSSGWYHTGDLGYLTEEGGLVVTGRAKDMIIRGGENIYPVEIENILIGMKEIDDAHVVGVPNNRTGQEVAAYIKVNSMISDDAILQYVKKELAHFKVPKYIKRVEHFPMTVTGKVQKYKLVEQAKKDFLEINYPS